MKYYLKNSEIDRTVLTAAHCVCNSPKAMKRAPDLAIPCSRNRNEPHPMYKVDQQIPPTSLSSDNDRGHPLEENELEDMWKNDIKTKYIFNVNTIRIGSRDFTQGITKRVIHAFAMYTNSKTRPDIAIIITEKLVNRLDRYPESHVAPICLPTR